MKRSATSLVFAGNAVYALPALAADEGLPQFNTALFPEQLFWLVVSFGALYLLMKYVALPGVESVQDNRKQVIDTALSTAKQANEQAKAMGHEADKALSDARAKANATVNAMKADAAKVAAEQQAAQGKQINARLREAEAGIATTRDKALKEIEATAADLAAAIVDSVSNHKVKA